MTKGQSAFLALFGAVLIAIGTVIYWRTSNASMIMVTVAGGMCSGLSMVDWLS